GAGVAGQPSPPVLVPAVHPGRDAIEELIPEEVGRERRVPRDHGGEPTEAEEEEAGHPDRIAEEPERRGGAPARTASAARGSRSRKATKTRSATRGRSPGGPFVRNARPKAIHMSVVLHRS